MSRLKEASDSIRKKKTVQPGREDVLEKGDFLALCKAAYAVFGKAALLVILFFAAVIGLLVLFWTL